MIMKEFEIFKLEDRVLFEAAAAAEIVEAASAAQYDPNAEVSESDRQAQQERNALKNAPPENPAAAADPVNNNIEDISDVDARIDALIEGEIASELPKELVVINGSVVDKGAIRMGNFRHNLTGFTVDTVDNNVCRLTGVRNERRFVIIIQRICIYGVTAIVNRLACLRFFGLILIIVTLIFITSRQHERGCNHQESHQHNKKFFH